MLYHSRIFTLLRFQGMAAFEMLYAITEVFLKQNKSIVIEGAFFTKYARPALRMILSETHAQYLEVFCYVDPVLQRGRYRKRALGDTRHPGHLGYGTEFLKGNDDYEKLDLGECLEMDTSGGTDQAMINSIASRIRQKLEETSNKDQKEI